MTEPTSSVSKGAGREPGIARPHEKPLIPGSRFSFQYSQTTFICKKSLPCSNDAPAKPGDLTIKIWVIKSRPSEFILLAFIY